MKNTPLISIILPVYNGEKYLAQSIESCLNQTYKNIELIIVNDCSIDSSLEIAEYYAKIDNRVRVISNIENKRLPASLNIGHYSAFGDYLTWTSDDNIYNLNAIKVLVEAVEFNNVDVVYSNISLINNNGEVISRKNLANFENLIFGNFVGSCFLYKKEVFKKNDGYNENLFLVEDYDFWLRASLHSKFYHLKEDLYNYRVHVNSLTNNISESLEDNRLWERNIKSMYERFVNEVFKLNYEHTESISVFQLKIHTHKKISFEYIIINFKYFEAFIEQISLFPNYHNIKAVRKVFLNKVLSVLVLNSSRKKNFKRSIFIIKKFRKNIDFNTMKLLIKYSFFK